MNKWEMIAYNEENLRLMYQSFIAYVYRYGWMKDNVPAYVVEIFDETIHMRIDHKEVESIEEGKTFAEKVIMRTIQEEDEMNCCRR